MKNKTLKIIALAVALLLIGFILVFANAMVGNPFSKWMAKSSAEKHLEENYSGRDFVIEEVFYSFKDGNYYARVKSPTSMDSSFSLGFDGWGRFYYDSYESDVASRWNTVRRLSTEYRDMVDEVLKSPDFPYTSHIDFGDLKFIHPEENRENIYPGLDYGCPMENLELDKNYDMKEMGKKHGRLVLYIESQELTAEKAAEIMLGVKKIMDEKEVTFFAMDFTLELPRNKESLPQDIKTLNILNFPYTDIYEENMVERVEKAIAETQAYYDFMDQQREEEFQKIVEK